MHDSRIYSMTNGCRVNSQILSGQRHVILSPIDAHYKCCNETRAAIEDLQQDVSETNDKVVDLQECCNETRAAIEDLQQDVSETNDKVADLQECCNEPRAAIEDLQRQIDEFNEPGIFILIRGSIKK